MICPTIFIGSHCHFDGHDQDDLNYLNLIKWNTYASRYQPNIW